MENMAGIPTFCQARCPFWGKRSSQAVGETCLQPAGSQALRLLLPAPLLPSRLFLGSQGARQALTFHTCVSLK